MAFCASFLISGLEFVNNGSIAGIISLLPITARVRQASRTRSGLAFVNNGLMAGIASLLPITARVRQASRIISGLAFVNNGSMAGMASLLPIIARVRQASRTTSGFELATQGRIFGTACDALSFSFLSQSLCRASLTLPGLSCSSISQSFSTAGSVMVFVVAFGGFIGTTVIG